MTINVTLLKSLKPNGKPRKIHDSNGLFAYVSASGGVSWRFRYRVTGREKTLTIGQWPLISLAEARERAIDARRCLAAGGDPCREKKQAIRQARQEEMCRFDSVVNEWFRLKLPVLSPRVARDQRRLLERDILSALGSIPVAELKPLDLVEFIRKNERARGQNIAKINLSFLRGVLRYAVQCGMIESNPAAELTGIVRRTRKGHRLALAPDAIAPFLSGLDGSDCHPYTKYALRLLLLTMVRAGEVCGAEWSEIDFRRRMWVIPAERMKMKRDHLVPLSSQALEILKAMKPMTGNNRWVFPTSSKAKHLMPCALSTAMLRLGWKDKATPHGFRALASTVLNEHAFSPDAIERQLAHCEKNAVRAAYNRAEYLPERTRMLQWWADFVSHREQPDDSPAPPLLRLAV